jgi:PPOX class probable F420-dependent enzyme
MEYRKLEEVEQRALLTARYISLETFRRDGRGVATPVWCAEEDGELYLFSAADAGKVKRIRGRERSTIARCDVRGRVLGPRIETRARIVIDPDEQAKAHRTLLRRYGWQMRLTDLLSRLAGRIDQRAMIALVPADAEDFRT